MKAAISLSCAEAPAALPGRVHVIGASGRSGQALTRALIAAGVETVPIVRSAARWAATGLPGAARLAELADPAAVRASLADAVAVVSCAHARNVPAVLAAAPPDARFVFLGSTRKFTRWPDAHARGVIAGERAFLASGRPGAILHPAMIYGAAGEDNVQRLAALLRRLLPRRAPLVPLPQGGRALAQPIFQDDVTRAILAALAQPWPGPVGITIAGPEPLAYADFVRAVAAAAGLCPPRIVSVPALPLHLLVPLTRLLPGLPTISRAELRRLSEDKAFDIGPMRAMLGVEPVSLAQGLASTFTNH